MIIVLEVVIEYLYQRQSTSMNGFQNGIFWTSLFFQVFSDPCGTISSISKLTDNSISQTS